jgi:hypothetical protein
MPFLPAEVFQNFYPNFLEASMRKIKDNLIEPPALQLSVNLHRVDVNTMQNPGP